MIIRSACRVSMSEGEEPDYRQIIPDANLRRRIGRIVRMGLAAASGCVGRADGVKPDAVIASTALGCLADTEKFMKEMIEREESMLNPSAFIYSTFNTIAGQIALAGGIRELVGAFTPDYASIEDPFVGRNASTAIILGMARGAILTALAESSVPVYSYSPSSAKRAAFGSGKATKEQVALMVSAETGIGIERIPLDATDAIALAICHAQKLLHSGLCAAGAGIGKAL